MPFWGTAAVTDPKRSFRWVLDLGVDGLADNISYICKKVKKPVMNIAEAEHKFLNHSFFYPGSVSYEKVTMVLVDPANPDAAQALYNLIQDSGYELPGNITDDVGVGLGTSTISKRLATSKINDCKITMLDGSGNRIEETVLKNAWISKVDFGGELDYETEALMEISVEFRYDWFELKTFEQS